MALKIALGISLLGICGLLTLYVALFAWLRNSLPNGFADFNRRSANEVELPFLGPDPWLPAEQLEGRAGRYVLEKYGFRIDLPCPPVSEKFSYSREDAESLVASFGYLNSNPDFDYFVYGLQVKEKSEQTLDAAAGWFEMMYEEDESCTSVRLRHRKTQWGGVPAIRISGSFLYFGDRWFVDGLVTVHQGLHIAALAQSEDRTIVQNRVNDFVRSTIFKAPGDPWPKPQEAPKAGSAP